MHVIKRMSLGNAVWAHEVERRCPDLLASLHAGQAPSVLWIGCADSRVPAETITMTNPGELFVHRTIANLVCKDDSNAMSVIEYAVKVLNVKDIVVCGHYECGGVRASLLPPDDGLPHVQRRIAPLRGLAERCCGNLSEISNLADRTNRLVEFSVLEQVRCLSTLPIVRDMPSPPRVHGWVFDLRTGRLRDLTITSTSAYADS